MEPLGTHKACVTSARLETLAAAIALKPIGVLAGRTLVRLTPLKGNCQSVPRVHNLVYWIVLCKCCE